MSSNIETPSDSDDATTRRSPHFAALYLGALGVVYGDIGTSPLYAIRECFQGHHAIALSPSHIYGVLSLIFWSVMLIVSFKYIFIVLRANNRGEGGEMALLALISQHAARAGLPRPRWAILIGIAGASLIYGDGIITPAISVLSAVEGLKVATPLLEPFVIPISLVILIVLFLVQSKGTDVIGKIFGPVMLLWFAVLGVLGAISIASNPSVLLAMNPLYAIEMLSQGQLQSFFVLGAVFLAVTGAEALYADMGHFGQSPIRIAWFSFVLPALLINYFGQGALLLADSTAVVNPFYHLAPSFLLYPLVGLSTLATIIASQAMISGAFSISRQAIQLGYLPRFEIRHTSSSEIGQIYVPIINWLLLIGVIWLVLTFQTSSSLANAYGVGVSSTMLITTVLVLYVARTIWRWPILPLVLIGSLVLMLDLVFLATNLPKIKGGGWFPLLVGAAVFTVMTTWRHGRELLNYHLHSRRISLDDFFQDIDVRIPKRQPGTAIFMSRSTDLVPNALHHNVRHNRVLHEWVLVVSIVTEESPTVPGEQRVEIFSLGTNLYQVVLHYGYTEIANVPRALKRLAPIGVDAPLDNATYFLSRETVVPTNVEGMSLWREYLFAFLSRNAYRAASYYNIPSAQVVEIGAQVDI